MLIAFSDLWVCLQVAAAFDDVDGIDEDTMPEYVWTRMSRAAQRIDARWRVNK